MHFMKLSLELRFHSPSRAFPNKSRLSRCISTTTPARSTNRNQEAKEQSIVGTVPYHTAYTLLRHPKLPLAYPPKLDSAFSPLGRSLTLYGARAGALVNFWSEGVEEDVVGSEEKEKELDTERYPFLHYSSTGSSSGVPVRRGTVSSEQVGSFYDVLATEGTRSESESNGALLLVCTHGARDCRCGDTGGALIRALRAELKTRQASGDSDNIWDKIKLGEIAHVGGHKYAANLLAFPFGDWLGNLTPAHAPLVLDAVSTQLRNLRDKSEGGSGQLPPLIAEESHWRGRMGLTKEEQVQFLESWKRL